jgi:DNA-binding CsgD family transcriptional regulator
MHTGPDFRSEFVANLYHGVLGGDGVGCVPKLLLDVVPGQSAVISMCMSPTSKKQGATFGLPDDTFERYASYYHSVDPWYLTAGQKLAPQTALRGTSLVSRRDFADTEFCTDFARHVGTVLALGGHIFVPGAGMCHFSIHRDATSRDFTDHDVARLQWCMPHLLRVLQLGAQLGQQTTAALAFSALDAVTFGTIVCDAHGTIQFCNAAAITLAEQHCGIVLGGKGIGLKALVPAESEQLSTLINQTCGGGAGSGMAITERDGGKLLILVVPLPQENGALPPLALVTLRSSGELPRITHTMLENAFGLTFAETRLITKLVDGTALPEIATAWGLSENTLRTQVASILSKTGARNQKDLIRLIGILPQVN